MAIHVTDPDAYQKEYATESAGPHQGQAGGRFPAIGMGTKMPIF